MTEGTRADQAPDLLVVSGLAESYVGVPVLQDVGFTLNPGEAIALVGPNGAGKTTLLRCVAGIEEPDEGVVELDGRRLAETDPEVRAAMACLLDDFDYFPDLSVGEHLRLYAWAHGVPDPRARSRRCWASSTCCRSPTGCFPSRCPAGSATGSGSPRASCGRAASSSSTSRSSGSTPRAAPGSPHGSPPSSPPGWPSLLLPRPRAGRRGGLQGDRGGPVTLTTARPRYPGPRELRRRRRAGRPRRPLRKRLSVLAERAIYAAVGLAIAAEAVPSTLGHVGAAGRAPVAPITPVIEWAVVVAAVLGLVALARALLAFGPVYVGAASRTWLLATPVDRAGLLAAPLAVAVASGAGLAAGIGLVLLLVTHLGPPPVPWLTGWAALGAAITCGCAVAQARRRPVPALRRGAHPGRVRARRRGARRPAAPPRRPAAPADRGRPAMWAAALALVGVAAAALYAARRHLADMTRGTAGSGGELALAAQVSLLSLDGSLFWPVVTERRLRALGRVRPAGDPR